MEKNDFDIALKKANFKTKKDFAEYFKLNPKTINNWGVSQNIPYWVESWLNNYIEKQALQQEVWAAKDILTTDIKYSSAYKDLTKEDLQELETMPLQSLIDLYGAARFHADEHMPEYGSIIKPSNKVDPNNPKEVASESIPSLNEAKHSNRKTFKLSDIKSSSAVIRNMTESPAENFMDDILNYGKTNPDKLPEWTKALMQTMEDNIEKMIDKKLQDKEDKK